MKRVADMDDAADVMAAPDARPWAQRLPGESVSEFRVFGMHRDSGHRRSITALAKRLGCKRQTLYVLSSRWKWGQRIAGYEAWLDRQLIAAQVELAKKTAAKEVLAEYRITALLAENAKRLLAKQASDPKFIIQPGAHAQIADMTARQSRVGRGDVSDRVEARGDGMSEVIATLKGISDKRKAVKDGLSDQ